MADLSRVLSVYKRYVEARNELLNELQLNRRSNRDPLSEFSEWLVAALVDGILADSPVQKDWDVQEPDGQKIQVKYLTNSADRWVNEHTVHVNAWMDSYAIVIYEALLPQAVLIFAVRNLEAVGVELGKRHSHLDATLQFTQANYRQICNSANRFRNLGVRLYLAPDWLLQ